MRRTDTGRILLVDHQPHVRAALADALSANGHVCTECTGGAEAYIRVRREQFDVVVSDVQISDINGLELLEMVTALRNGPKVVLTSDQPDAQWVRRAFRRGAHDFVPKPFDVQELRQIIENALFERRTEAQADPKSATRGPRFAHPQRDASTGLWTRQAFAETLAQLRDKCRPGNEKVSLLILDIEQRGGGSETPAPPSGDELPRWVGKSLEQVCHPADPAVRSDAGRFMLALDDSDETRALDVGRRFREVFLSRLPTNDRSAAAGRLSIGVAESQPGFLESEADLIERALAALAHAKRRGGGQTSCWSQVSPAGPSRRELEGASLDEISRWIGTTRQQLKRSYIESTMALVAAVEAKEPYARGHANAVSHFCEMIARQMGQPTSLVESLKVAALLHDIGKIGVPDVVLQKPGPLTPDEFALIKKHPETALEILSHSTFFQDELPYILHHHERYDGAGYPGGLAGQDIPLGARILSVADSLAVMLATRTYKAGLTADNVKEELARCAGDQFDSAIVDAALRWIEAEPQALVIK